MLKSICIAIFIGATAFLPWHNAAFGKEKLLVITEDFPPFNYYEGRELKGFAVEIVKTIQTRLGISNEIKVYPWARGYHFLKTRKNTVLFSTARSKEREDLFIWVGPYAEVKLGFYGKSNRAQKLNSLGSELINF